MSRENEEAIVAPDKDSNRLPAWHFPRKIGGELRKRSSGGSPESAHSRVQTRRRINPRGSHPKAPRRQTLTFRSDLAAGLQGLE